MGWVRPTGFVETGWTLAGRAYNGNTLKCRASEAIPGSISPGSKVDKVVSLAVEIGDYLGMYAAVGNIERDGSGFVGIWRIDEYHIDPDDEATYYIGEDDAISLGGYIAVPALGRSFGFIIG